MAPAGFSALVVAGGRDHLRRRRLARRQRGRERIAAGQRRRDRQRRRRARRAGSGSRQRMIARSIAGSRSRTISDGGVIAVLLALRDQLREVASVERAAAGEELVEHEPERVDVAARRDLAAGELLGRHVGRRAGAQRLRPAAPARPKSVMRIRPLPSSMMFAGFRSRWTTPRSCAAASPAQICRASSIARSCGKRPMRRSSDDEILAVHVFHRQERVPVEFADVVDAADVRDATPAAPSALRCAAASAARDRDRPIPGRNFSATGCPSLQIVGAVDLAHAAFAEASDDAVAVVEERAGREAAVVDRVGARQPAAAW